MCGQAYQAKRWAGAGAVEGGAGCARTLRVTAGEGRAGLRLGVQVAV